jgi:hypothetical protein
VRVPGDRLPERLGDVQVAVLGGVELPWPDLPGEDLVGQVIVAVGAREVVQRRAVGAEDGRVAGVVLEVLPGRIAVDADVATVQPADGAGFGPPQLLGGG